MIILHTGLVTALLAWLATGAGRHRPHRMVGPLYLVTIPMLILHGVEQSSGRLYDTLPRRFGLEPFQASQFVGFNLVWLAIFLLAAVGAFSGNRLSLLVVWFVALLGCIGNALFHGLIALQDGAHVPGVITALINLPLGVALAILLGGGRTRRQEKEMASKASPDDTAPKFEANPGIRENRGGIWNLSDFTEVP